MGLHPPGDNAESYEILSWRVGSWFRAITRPTVAVCHGGVIRCLFKLSGTLDKDAAAKMEVPQDKILRRRMTARWHGCERRSLPPQQIPRRRPRHLGQHLVMRFAGARDAPVEADLAGDRPVAMRASATFCSFANSERI